MTVEIKVPELPESVSDATIAAWHKKVGDFVTSGESIRSWTDKELEVPASSSGVLTEILQKEGDVVVTDQKLAVDTDAKRSHLALHQHLQIILA